MKILLPLPSSLISGLRCRLLSWLSCPYLIVGLLSLVSQPSFALSDNSSSQTPVGAPAADSAPAGSALPSAEGPVRPLRIVGARFIGLERTDPEWLTSYIDLAYPVQLPPSAADAIAKRLLTTGVFTSVKATFEPVSAANAEQNGIAEEYVLQLKIEEKWTTIPVLRAAYGGGIPLKAVGLYDIHTFGRLITAGGEARSYGDAPPGFVLYARDPRHESGRYYLGAELWRDFRLRPVYENKDEILGRIATNSTIARVRLLRPYDPIPESGHSFPWRIGFDLELANEAASVFELDEKKKHLAGSIVEESPHKDLVLSDRTERVATILPIVQYDDINVDLFTLDGFRGEVKAGPQLGTRHTQFVAQAEAYWYRRLPGHFNLAMHGLAYHSSLNTLSNLYFLGGLDSIRGLPDSALYGLKAAYMNFELRHLTTRMRYLWIQTVFFNDSAVAGPRWEDALERGRSFAGIGVRIGVPQVYRLAIRIDYAWSVDGSGAHGLSAGMNHYFDPYKPL